MPRSGLCFMRTTVRRRGYVGLGLGRARDALFLDVMHNRVESLAVACPLS